MKDLDNLFIESNTVRAKFNPTEEMRNQIPKDSVILKGFDKLQDDYNLFEGKINQVCHQLNSIDKKFNQENYTNKETDATYEGKYASFVSIIKKLGEEKKEKEEEPPPEVEKGEIDIDKLPPGKENSDHTKYENLLRDLDEVLIDSVSAGTNFNAIEEMKETAPTDSVIFYDSIVCKVIISKLKRR